MKRELSPHVVTRWYRSPELILMEKDYGKKIDVWSIGAIFAEMMIMREENELHYSKRKPFFPGRSCYPLSPDKKRKKKSSKSLDGDGGDEGSRKSSKVADDDQLSVIISKIGPLSEEDMSFLSASKQTTYLKQFNIDCESIQFDEIFPYESPDALDLLKKMLSFNPYFRVSVEECLEHPYFDDVEKDSDEEDPEIDANSLTVQFDHCSESELRQILEETFEYFAENRDKLFGL